MAPLPVDVVTLMEQRQTRREFTRELSIEQLGEFLWLACRSRSSRESPFGPSQESRVHPSAGAMHPIHVLVARDGEAFYRYDPSSHALVEVPESTEGAQHAIASAQASLELGRGWVLAFVAEPGKTGSKYEHPESLVWRDAGVVLGYMSVVAETLGLAFCLLGMTGDPIDALGLQAPDALHGVGLAVLGSV